MKKWMRFALILFAATAIAGCSKSDSDNAKTAKAESNSEKASRSERGSEKPDRSGGSKASSKIDKVLAKTAVKSPSESATRSRPAVPVKTAIVEEGSITSSLVFDSVLETESSVEIFSESAGLILEVLVEEGDRVQSGQILARLDNETQQVDADESKARYEHEKVDFQRSTDLYERNLINQKDYDSAKFALEQMRLRYERSRILLENTIVRATVDGVVTERVAQVGSRVSANRKLFSLMNLDELFANVNISGQYLLNVKQGLGAVIDSDLMEGVQYDAFVKLVSPVVDPQTGTFKAKVAVSKDNGMPIYPGMFVNVRIIVDTRENSILVPKDAVVHEGDLKYIFTVQNGKAKKQLLQEGYSNVEYVQATSGVNKGDAVIVMGHNALKDGANVKVVVDAASADENEPLLQSKAEG